MRLQFILLKSMVNYSLLTNLRNNDRKSFENHKRLNIILTSYTNSNMLTFAQPLAFLLLYLSAKRCPSGIIWLGNAQSKLYLFQRQEKVQ